MIVYITTYSKRISYAKKIKEIFEHSGLEYYFVYGKNNLTKLEPYIEMDCDETYENLPLKTYCIMDHFLQDLSRTRMIKINDDTYVDINRLKQMTLTEDYIGSFVDYPTNLKSQIFHWFKVNSLDYKVKKQTFNLSYAEGSFYSLSRKAAEIILKHGRIFFTSTPETYLGEDTKVGMCLANANITKKDITTYKLPYYEIMDDYTIIHPVHHTLFNKIKNTSNQKELVDLLGRSLMINDNVLREIYLEKQIKNL